jgi:hypothetical protein
VALQVRDTSARQVTESGRIVANDLREVRGVVDVAVEPVDLEVHGNA